MIVLLIGAVMSVDAIVSYALGKSVGGYPSLIVILVLGVGAIMSSLGIIAVYIAKMFNEIKDRPRYIVR